MYGIKKADAIRTLKKVTDVISLISGFEFARGEHHSLIVTSGLSTANYIILPFKNLMTIDRVRINWRAIKTVHNRMQLFTKSILQNIAFSTHEV